MLLCSLFFLWFGSMDVKQIKYGLIETCKRTGTIDLSHQGLEEVPSWVWRISSLVKLDLEGNALTHFVIPKDAAVPALECIYLRGNKIATFSTKCKELPHLAVVDLRDNLIAEMPTAFSLVVGNSGFWMFRGFSEAPTTAATPFQKFAPKDDSFWTTFGGAPCTLFHASMKKSRDGKMLASHAGHLFRYYYWSRRHYPSTDSQAGFWMRVENCPVYEQVLDLIGLKPKERLNDRLVQNRILQKWNVDNAEAVLAESLIEEEEPEYDKMRQEKKNLTNERERKAKIADQALNRERRHNARVKLDESM